GKMYGCSSGTVWGYLKKFGINRSISDYNKSEIARKRSRAVGLVTGAKNITKYNKSENSRVKASKRMILWNKSDQGREVSRGIGRKYGNKSFGMEIGRCVLIAYNKSEKGKETSSKNLAKFKTTKLTKHQEFLAKSLNDKGVKNILEYFVAGIRRIIDIAIPEIKLAIEIDGGSHTDRNFIKLFGKSLEEKQADDLLKDQQLQSLGWEVLRVTDQDVENNLSRVVDSVVRSIEHGKKFFRRHENYKEMAEKSVLSKNTA
ncbi:MAG: DUF559 domain-containing protein, partial [Candidatus Roizmanbacteria bacterium]|nr:DUF559 domain-containing protein [Candidatus Roizmanbacteria bacterium]